MTETLTPNPNLQVFGALLLGFAQACVNLRIIAGDAAMAPLQGVDPTGWYPFDRLLELEGHVLGAYSQPGPILEQIGVEMMLGWYNFGPGKTLVHRGVDFLRFQTGSEGYASVVLGPPERVGRFALAELDEARGRARITSTTPFHRDVERGVILGGLSAPGDLDWIDVNNDDDPDTFLIEFL